MFSDPYFPAEPSSTEISSSLDLESSDPLCLKLFFFKQFDNIKQALFKVHICFHKRNTFKGKNICTLLH